MSPMTMMLVELTYAERLLEAEQWRKGDKTKREMGRKRPQRRTAERLPRMRNMIQRLFGGGLAVREAGR